MYYLFETIKIIFDCIKQFICINVIKIYDIKIKTEKN